MSTQNRIVKGHVVTNKVGSACYFEFEVGPDATPADIEEEAREAMFGQIDWSYTVDGEPAEYDELHSPHEARLHARIKELEAKVEELENRLLEASEMIQLL